MFCVFSKFLAYTNSQLWSRSICMSTQHFVKVTICGAGTPVGQTLSLLVKLNPLVSRLCLYDTVDTKGLAADLSHIDRWSTTESYQGAGELPEALYCTALVLICAGESYSGDMKREELFKANAKIVQDLVTAVPSRSPAAWIGIITEPINSLVPMAAEALRTMRKYCRKRLFGIPAIDVVRTRTFISHEMPDCDPALVQVPVIGGHSDDTVVPLISQCHPRFHPEVAVLQRISQRVRDAGQEVLTANKGQSPATYSVAYAASRVVDSCLSAITGGVGRVECLYVESKLTEAPFFTSPVELSRHGISHILDLPRINTVEHELLMQALHALRIDADAGVNYLSPVAVWQLKKRPPDVPEKCIEKELDLVPLSNTLKPLVQAKEEADEDPDESTKKSLGRTLMELFTAMKSRLPSPTKAKRRGAVKKDGDDDCEF